MAWRSNGNGAGTAGSISAPALDWLSAYDRNAAAIKPILATVYGAAMPLWFRRWRLFFLATAGLFGDSNGEEWGVSHYLLKSRQGPGALGRVSV